MLTGKQIKDIEARHIKVAAGDMRFTDKVAHRDRGLLLAYIFKTDAEAEAVRKVALALYSETTGAAVRRQQ